MKFKLLIFALLASISVFACSTEIDVPQAVKAAFAKKYPTAQKVEWEMEDATEYEAEFKMDGKEMAANFNTDGTWLVTETEIKTKDLPQAVKDAIAKSFPNYELEEAEQMEKPGMALAYEVQLENEETDEELEAVFAADGTLLEKKIKDDEDEDDDEGEDGGME